MNIRLKQDKGFTLLEIIIAISILTFGILAVAAMQGAALRGDTYAFTRTEASTWAQDQMENLMSLPYTQMVANGDGSRNQDNFDIDWFINPTAVANTSRIDVTVTYYGRQIASLTANRSSLFD